MFKYLVASVLARVRNAEKITQVRVFRSLVCQSSHEGPVAPHTIYVKNFIHGCVHTRVDT